MKVLNPKDYSLLSENEFKLFSNIRAYKANKNGIAELPYNGDGFISTEERFLGYKNLKKHGYIHFDENKVRANTIQYPDVDLTEED